MSEQTAEEIERGLLGAILVAAEFNEGDDSYAKQLLGNCRRKGVNEKWFSAGNNRRMWEAMTEECDARDVIDPILVAQRLGADGGAILEGILSGSAQASHFEFYLDALVERRVYIEYHRWLRDQLTNLTPQSARCAVTDASKRIGELQTLAMGGGETLKGVDDFVEQLIEEKRWLSEERFVRKNWGKYRGVPMPWSQLNIIYKGLKTGLHIIAALPSQGKTTVAVNISNYWCARGIKHGIACLDMPGDSLVERYAAVRAQLSISKLDFGASPKYVDEFETALREIAKDDMVKITESETISQLEYEISRGVKALGWKTVIVDYLQLIDPEMKGANAPYVLAKEATVRMKKLAKKLRIPIICLVQLSNQFAKDKATGAKKPRLDHLGDTSEIARAARSVAVVYQDEDVVDYWKENMPYDLMYYDRKKRLEGNWTLVEQSAETFREMGQPNMIADGGIRPIWFSVIKNQQGGRGDVPFIMYAKYFMLRPGDMEGESQVLGDEKHPKKVAVGQFAIIRDDWLYNPGDEILERTGGIGTRWMKYPGETNDQYLERVKQERSRHNSNSGMWDQQFERQNGCGIRIGFAEFDGEVAMAVEKITEEEMS